MEWETWKDIQGYEGKYQISDLGNVRSLNYNNTKLPKNLKLKVNKLGFLEVKLSKNNKTKDFMVARLVLETFKPTQKADNVVINIDGDKTNCRLDNLKWVYHSEQRHIMYNKGNRKVGEPTNTRISYHKEGYKNLAELAKAYLIDTKRFMNRLERGWSIEDAIEVPVDIKNKGKKPYFYEYYGKYLTLEQISKITGISAKTINKRLCNHWSIYEAAEIPVCRKGGI